MNKNKYGRKPPFRQTKEEVLVVCGGKTEQIYFDIFKQKFKPSLGNIIIVTALKAQNPIQIVEYAINIRQQKNSYNSVWCVFDKDDFPDFDEAIDYAKQNGIYTAYSNQAFEIWFINHYRRLYTSLHRNKYKDELNKFLSFPYDKDHGTITRVCDTILTENKLKEAIKNTRYGYEYHKTYTKSKKASEYESCTTIFMLVRDLLNWIE